MFPLCLKTLFHFKKSYVFLAHLYYSVVFTDSVGRSVYAAVDFTKMLSSMSYPPLSIINYKFY